MLKFTIVAAALSIAAPPALADYKAEYKLYAAAVSEGDVEAAIKYGSEAWKQGEVELGDHKTTAILAFNFGNIIYEFDAAKAVPAFERALDLVDRGVSDLDGFDVRLALAASKFATDKENKALYKNLETAIAEFEAADRPIAFIAADAVKLLAMAQFVEGDHKSSGKLAEKAASLAENLTPKPKGLLATAYAIAGISYGADRHRSRADITKSAELLDRAIVLFPPQKGIDAIHPLFAQAMAWRFSVNAIAQSEGRASALDHLDRDLDADAMCRFEQARPANCEIKWKKRTPPKYPAKALSKAYVGSVLVGYDLNDTGVERTVLLAGVNGAALADPAIASMLNWELAETPSAECRMNHIVNFSFVVN